MLEIVKMIVVLAAICGISGFSLSYLKQTTQPIIEEQVLTFVQGPAIKSVYPSATNDPIADRKEFAGDAGAIVVFPYKKDNALIGIAIEAKGKGYGGDIGVIVGINTQNQTLLGIGITEMKETPGLGSMIANPKFTSQFVDKPFAVGLKSKGGQVDAVSGATISSSGTIAAIQNAVGIYEQHKDAINKAWQ